MTLFTRVFKFYIESSLHVAFAIVSLVRITQWEFDLDLNFDFYAFIFFGSISGYNFIKYAAIAGLHHRSLTESLRTIQVFSFLCTLAFIYFITRIPQEALYWVAGFAFLSLLYAIPAFGGKSLRTLPGTKLFVVSLVWAGTCLIVPVVSSNTELIDRHWLSTVQYFLLVIALTLPFEIRDLRYDHQSLVTIPQLFGLKKTKYLGLMVLLVIVVVENIKPDRNLSHAVALYAIVFVTGIFILRSKSKQSPYYASFWVESVPIIWVALNWLTIEFLA